MSLKKTVFALLSAGVLLCSISCSNDDNGSKTSAGSDVSQKETNPDGTTTLKIQENGNGFVSHTGTIKTEFAGWTGTGYLDGLAEGGNVVYTVSATEDITDAKIAIHYLCTEVTRIRAALVSVNGTLINADKPLAMTTKVKVKKDNCSAANWKDTVYLENVSLKKGSNSIIITGASAGTYTAAGESSITIQSGDTNSLNYVDYLIVTGKGIDFGTDTTKYFSFACASENTTAGSVASDATNNVAENSKITLTATANTGWRFECWSTGATENPYTFTITDNTIISAHFIPSGYAAPSASDGYLGYATLTADNQNAKYTITGGAGASSENKVTITTFEELTSTYSTLLASHTPAVIKISGEISTKGQANPLLSVKVNIGSNKTIYGDPENENQGWLRNIGIVISGENIIVRNMKFGEVISWDKPFKSGADDAFSLNQATHVWVDHCEFQSHLTPQDLDGKAIISGHNYYSTDEKWKKDFYDGLFDVKNGSSWITISNCYFHDHWKACLCASGDEKADKNTRTGATDVNMRITFFNNYWKNINARQPMLRYGKAHVFNSYFLSESSEMSGQSTGINCRAGSEFYIDNNIFENLKTPIGFYNDTSATRTGFWVNKDNTFTGCTNPVESSSTSYIPPYKWTPKTASETKTYVLSNAGVGRLSASDLSY